MRLTRRSFVASTMAGLACSTTQGCADIVTSFPEGLAPLATNTASFPPAAGGDPTPEALSAVTGSSTDEQGRVITWAHAKGYIHAPLARVWTAMRTPGADVDRREVSSFTVTPEQDPTYAEVFRIRNVVNGAVTIMFDIRWRHGLVSGSTDAPAVVAARWSKVQGTQFIEIMRGSCVARRAQSNPAVTEVEFVYEVSAFSRTEQHSAQFCRDVFDSWLAVLAGRPLPTYR